MSPDILVPLQNQANIISKGDQDLSQDLLAMSLQNYRNTLNNNRKELTIGELTNFMKYRRTELKSGKRRYFGNNNSCAKNDVFNKWNYYKGELELLSLDFKDNNDHEEDPLNGKGEITSAIAFYDMAEQVMFKVSFEVFLSHMDRLDRRILQLKFAGYKWKEISKILKIRYPVIKQRITDVGLEFVSFFDLPEGYLYTYGLLKGD